MDDKTLLVLIIVSIPVVGGAMIGAMVLLSYIFDAYKGVRPFSSLVREEMDRRWLHHECLAGHGVFCRYCRKERECYKRCEEHMKRVIDAEQESEADYGRSSKA